MACLGLDTSGDFKVIGVVIGNISELNNLYRELLNEIGEFRIHSSKLKRDKRLMLINLFYKKVRKYNKIKFLSLDFDLFEKAKALSKLNRIPKTKAAGLLFMRILKSIFSQIEVSINLIDIDKEFLFLEPLIRKFSKNRISITYRGMCSQLADLVAYLNFRKMAREPIRTIIF